MSDRLAATGATGVRETVLRVGGEGGVGELGASERSDGQKSPLRRIECTFRGVGSSRGLRMSLVIVGTIARTEA